MLQTQNYYTGTFLIIGGGGSQKILITVNGLNNFLAHPKNNYVEEGDLPGVQQIW